MKAIAVKNRVSEQNCFSKHAHISMRPALDRADIVQREGYCLATVPDKTSTRIMLNATD